MKSMRDVIKGFAPQPDEEKEDAGVLKWCPKCSQSYFDPGLKGKPRAVCIDGLTLHP